MVRNCRTKQAHVKDAYMYCTSRAAVYAKELRSTTSTCQGYIHVLHTDCSLVDGKEVQNTTSTCKEGLRIEICISQISFGRRFPARDFFEHGMSGMVYGGQLILKIIRALHKYKLYFIQRVSNWKPNPNPRQVERPLHDTHTASTIAACIVRTLHHLTS
jgi:hypothetical protein